MKNKLKVESYVVYESGVKVEDTLLENMPDEDAMNYIDTKTPKQRAKIAQRLAKAVDKSYEDNEIPMGTSFKDRNYEGMSAYDLRNMIKQLICNLNHLKS